MNAMNAITAPTQFNLVDIKRFIDNDFTSVLMSINDRIIDMNYASDFSIDADFETEQLPILGTKEDPILTNAVNISWSLSEYVVNSVMPKIVSDYMEFGTLPTIGFLITQNDPRSSSGQQVASLTDCTITGIQGLITAAAAGQHATRGISGVARSFRLLEEFVDVI